MPSVTHIPPADRIPTRQKFAFALGVNMDYVSTGLMIYGLWMPVFNIGLGLSPAILGGILMLLRAWDAVTDPIMGNISDNARTRWGRRRPFMFAGAILTASLYPLFWHIPGAWSDTVKAVALLAIGLAYFTCFTVWSMPYYGMQLELTPNYDERTRLTAWTTVFNKLGALAGGWILSIVIVVGTLAIGDTAAAVANEKAGGLARLLAPLQSFLHTLAAPEAGEKPIVVGMRIGCWLIAGGILCFGLMPALFVKERYYKAEASQQPRDPFWQSVRESLRCKPLWVLIGISFFLVIGSSSVSSLGQYANFYYVNHGDLAKAAIIGGWKSTAMVICGLASIPVLTWLSERFDKRSMVISMILLSMGGHLLNYVLMTPLHPYWQIIPGVFESSAIAAIWMFLPSMKADVADYDELHTSRRREGSINAFYSWFIKAALTFSFGLGGVMLQLSGFDAKLPAQPPEVLTRIFHLYLIIPIIIWSLALAVIWFYPLTRTRSVSIRTELEERRGKL
jgi:glycoside/pentoside/hexuronide:cation symporter, GPH family